MNGHGWVSRLRLATATAAGRVAGRLGDSDPPGSPAPRGVGGGRRPGRAHAAYFKERGFDSGPLVSHCPAGGISDSDQRLGSAARIRGPEKPGPRQRPLSVRSRRLPITRRGAAPSPRSGAASVAGSISSHPIRKGTCTERDVRRLGWTTDGGVRETGWGHNVCARVRDRMQLRAGPGWLIAYAGSAGQI